MNSFFRQVRIAALALACAVVPAAGALAAPFATAPLVSGPISGTISAKPANPFVPSGTPEIYCSNPLDDFPGPFDFIDLVNDGCVSGVSTKYINSDTGALDPDDGFYTSPGDYQAAVEHQILLATGQVVQMTLAAKLEDPNGSGRLLNATHNIDIQFWIENSGKQITWLMGEQATKFDYMTIKGANSFLLFDIRTGQLAGRYSTAGMKVPNGDSAPGISHVVFWQAEVPVSEPAMIGLFGVGLLTLGLYRRRRPGR